MATDTVMPLEAVNVKQLDYVDPDKFYRVDLQFGAKASWRDWQGRSRAIVPRGNGELEVVHNPKVVEAIGPFSGDIVNGLISANNEWVKSYNRHNNADYRGQLDRQILVLNCRETNDLPTSHQVSGMVPVSMLDRLIEDKLAAALSG
jgi:hypothetical protein